MTPAASRQLTPSFQNNCQRSTELMNIVPASDAEGRGSVTAEIGAFRIAILSTPRTGNTWLRRLLDAIYSLPQVVADTPDDVDWDQLPQRCILQLHWPADTALESLLSKHEFKVVTLFRNPCDTLISILHFATVWKNTGLWMGGLQGDESGVIGARPCSREFAKYVASDRAKLLIAASANWAETKNCLAISYEALVEDAASELKRVTDRLLPVSPEVISAAVEANSLTRLRACVQNQHFWRGQPGIWKTLLPQAVAQDIERHHVPTFARMGYTIEADQELTNADADANWATLELATIRQEMAESRRQLKETSNELIEARWEITALEGRIEPLVKVGPLVLRISERVNGVIEFYQGVVASLRRHLRMHEKSIVKGKGCEAS
jgi:hypothetical protein